MAGTIHSMTGFARSEGRAESPTPMMWSWEIRSVNNKGLDLRIRLPVGFDSLDGAVRQAVGEHVTRGSIAVTLSATADHDASGVHINVALLDRLVALVAEKSKTLPPGIAPARFDGLMAIKGVIDTQQPMLAPEQTAARDRALLEGLRVALSDLNRARRQEGERLTVVIAGQISSVSTLVTQAGSVGATQPEAIKAKMIKQIADLTASGAPVAPDRLAQEIALIAVKGDIREEIDRLISHVTQARDMVAAGGPCGRRLDFLSQELNREANTLCSKSPDVVLTRIGLDLKVVIDQFREQIQNIE